MKRACDVNFLVEVDTWLISHTISPTLMSSSLRCRQNFARECFCFGGEAVSGNAEAARSLVRSRDKF